MERVMVPSSPRTEVDRCPGLLRPHLAADGAVVRVRLPGGMITATALTGLITVAGTFANGEVQLTSRANVQLRGAPVDAVGDVPDALVDAVRATGLLPSDTAELVRNILCSPFTGRVGGFADLRPVVRRLDALLCAVPALANLPGRFLFGLDDGSGDISVDRCDLGILARPGGGALLMAGGLRGPVVDLEAAADQLVRMALVFLALRGDGSAGCWHVSELPGGAAAVLAAVANDAVSNNAILNDAIPNAAVANDAVMNEAALNDAAQHDHPVPAAAPSPPTTVPLFGAHRQADGRSLLSLVVPLGRLTPTQVHAVAAAARLGSGDLVITPGNGLIVTDLPMAVGSSELVGVAAMLAEAGLPSTADSGWIGVSACTGAPGCAKGAGPTGPVATRIAHLATASGARGRRVEPVHVVACERRCGAPAVAHREVMIELTGELSRHRPARADERTTRRRTALPTQMSTAATESA